jgi:hypothetical protein
MPSRPPIVGACNGIQHIPFPAVADHDGGDRRWISPGQATRSQISAGYPPFEKKGAVFWAGNTRPVLPETELRSG